MADKARMPRMREQDKDNASEVEKYSQSVAEMERQEYQHKEAELVSDPRNIAEEECARKELNNREAKEE